MKGNYRRQVQRVVRNLQPVMGLHLWQLTLTFEANDREKASCRADPEYLTAVLNFNPKRRADTKEALIELVAHELMHCHVGELGALADKGARGNNDMKEAVRQAEERLTTVSSRLLLLAMGVGGVTHGIRRREKTR